MKYHYEPPDISIPIYGKTILLNEHPFYHSGTLYFENGKGIIVVQQHFSRHSEIPDTKFCWWGPVDAAVANDIYLSPYFKKFFMQFAKEKDYNIYQVRKLMWSLRMKPLKKEPWEDYFKPA